MDELDRLIQSGPDPRFTIKAKVLSRFDDIRTARGLLRTWADITVALGLPRERWRDVSACFRRVEKAVESGKLRLPKAKQRSSILDESPRNRRQTNTGAGGASNYINLDEA
ncbi:hypothetical protein BAE30_07930 [Acidithiobacillus caldus]|uniref:Uncharacterized protein n=1 Tax=Acidithiobacillus caldus TaxID=33059 RepID=A0A1E7YVS4_9PROT|nr:hypothetical protein BAE30_07930 [Acidithiobacillus caldus]